MLRSVLKTKSHESKTPLIIDVNNPEAQTSSQTPMVVSTSQYTFQTPDRLTAPQDPSQTVSGSSGRPIAFDRSILQSRRRLNEPDGAAADVRHFTAEASARHMGRYQQYVENTAQKDRDEYTAQKDRDEFKTINE